MCSDDSHRGTGFSWPLARVGGTLGWREEPTPAAKVAVPDQVPREPFVCLDNHTGSRGASPPKDSSPRLIEAPCSS